MVVLAIYEPGKKIPPASSKLTKLAPKDINKIVIEQPQQPNIILKRNKNGWEMLEPLHIPANDILIDNLLSITTSNSHSRYSVSKVELDQFNLNTPDLKISFNDTTLAFGTTEPLGGSRYVLTNNEVHLITDRYTHLIRGKMTALVSPKILPGNAILTRLELPDLTLQSSNDGWTASPDTNFKSSDQIQKLLDEWHYARAMQVKQDNILPADSEKISAITIHTSNNGIYRFKLILQKDEIILYRSDMKLSYHFDKQTGERLLGHLTNESTPEETTPVKAK